MPSATLDLVNLIDKYLNNREDINQRDAELIIHLRNFIITQNGIVDNLLDERMRHVLQRQE